MSEIVVALIGDSTVTIETGWGKAFADRFNDRVKVLNFAMGGRSSKSFHDEGRLPAVLKARPDYVLIQFGHNDQPGKGPARETDPGTTYRDFLRIYVNHARSIGGRPILISSVTRRIFDAHGRIDSALAPWAEAARCVAAEMNVPFIDLHAASIEAHNRMGVEASMAFNPKPDDLTHLNAAGAEVVADMIVWELRSVDAELAAYLKQG